MHNQGRQSPQFHHFFDGLRRAGFVDNQNLIVDGRGDAVRTEQFAGLAAELAKSGEAVAENPSVLAPLKLH